MGKKKGKGKKGKGKKGKKGSVAAALPVVECPPAPPPQMQPMDPCARKGCESDVVDDYIQVEPNRYPNILREPAVMAVAGSEDGSYDSLCKLIRAGLRCAERVFIMAPWGNYVIVRARSKDGLIYFVYDGCTCDVNRFRYYDLSCGTAGFIHFSVLDDVTNYLIYSRATRMQLKGVNKVNVNDIVEEYGSCQYKQSNKCMKFK